MIRKTMLGLFTVLAIGLLLPAYADNMTPLQQYNSGTPIDEIQCSIDKILMESKSGKPYCLSENTAIKLADRGFSIVVLKEIISMNENVELSKTVWNSKDFPSLNSNENSENNIATTTGIPNDLFPKITTEIPSQVRVGEEFIVTVHLDYSPQKRDGYVFEFDPNEESSSIGFQLPKQIEFIPIDYPIIMHYEGTDDWYGQALHSYSILPSHNGEDIRDIELVFRINEPLLYDGEEFRIAGGGVLGGDYYDIWYLSSTDDVLTISPQPLFASGSDDSKFPDKDKKPISEKKSRKFVPGEGPVYSNLNALSPETRAGVERFFMHNYNMTAPQSNDSGWSPEAEASYQAWLESIKQTSLGVSGQAGPPQVFIHGKISFTDNDGDNSKGKYSQICLHDRNLLNDNLTPINDISNDPACSVVGTDGGFGFGVFNNDPNDNTTLDPVLVLRLSNDVVDVRDRLTVPYFYISDKGDENVDSSIPFNFGVIAVDDADQNIVGFKRAYDVHRELNISHEKFEQISGISLDKVLVHANLVYVGDKPIDERASYSPTNNIITFGYTQVLDIQIRDTVDHEYGHHAMNIIYNDAGGSFPNYTCQIHHIIRGGDRTCAWGEGFAHFFALALKDSPIFQLGRTDVYNFETRTRIQVPFNNGPTVEGNVAAALWDIYDTRNEAGDNINGARTQFWTTFADRIENTDDSSTANTIFDFEDDWDDNSYASLDQIFNLNKLRIDSNLEITPSFTSGNCHPVTKLCTITNDGGNDGGNNNGGGNDLQITITPPNIVTSGNRLLLSANTPGAVSHSWNQLNDGGATVVSIQNANTANAFFQVPFSTTESTDTFLFSYTATNQVGTSASKIITITLILTPVPPIVLPPPGNPDDIETIIFEDGFEQGFRFWDEHFEWDDESHEVRLSIGGGKTASIEECGSPVCVLQLHDEVDLSGFDRVDVRFWMLFTESFEDDDSIDIEGTMIETRRDNNWRSHEMIEVQDRMLDRWLYYTIDVSQYLDREFKVRFSPMIGSDDGIIQIDNVQIVGITRDDTPPVFSNVPSTINVNSNSLSGVMVNYTPPTSRDAISGNAMVICNPQSGQIFSVGTTRVTCQTQDESGNMSTVSFMVIVSYVESADTISPTLTIPGDKTFEATATLTLLTNSQIGVPTATDNRDPTPTVASNTPASFPVGTTTITYTATDTSGNITTDTQLITIRDTTPPTITAPANITLEATGLLSMFTLGSPTVSDLVDAAPTVTSNTPTSFPLGDTIITYTATDDYGNSATATQRITIQDTIAPTIILPADITAEATNLLTVLDIGTSSATDNVDYTITNDAPISFPLGTTIVTWRVSDSSGNIISDIQRIIITDTSPPTITAPANITLEATGLLSMFTLENPAVSDLVDAAPTVISNAPASFPVGITTITYTAIDNSGNIATATQTIIILDTTPPTITAPANITLEATGLLSMFTLENPAVSDLVDAAPTVISNAPASFPVGITAITYTVIDNSGNIATATQTITIRDTTPPTITAPENITLEATGLLSMLTLENPTVSDLVDAAPTVTSNAPTSFPLGDTIITYTATDDYGNSATATQTITIQDTSPLTIILPSDITAEATNLLTVLDIGTASTTGNVDYTITNNAPTSFPLGTTIVTWSVSDSSGNVISDTQRITITDTTIPVFITLLASESASTDESSIQIDYTIPTATDIFGTSIVCDPAPNTLFSIGDTAVTCTATDNNSNSAQISAIFTVTQSKSASITRVYDGTNFISFEDGISITNNIPKFQGTSSGISSIRVLIGDTQVGGNNIHSDGSFQKGWKHAPLDDGTYLLTINENGVQLFSSSFVIDSDGDGNIIADIINPTLTIPADKTFEATARLTPLSISQIGIATATDDATTDPAIMNNSTGIFKLGENFILYTATDSSDNFSTAIQRITIQDTTNPVIEPIDDITLESQSSITVNFDIISTDIFNVIVTCDPASDSLFVVGTTLVTCTAIDSSENQSEISFNVIITQPPPVQLEFLAITDDFADSDSWEFTKEHGTLSRANNNYLFSIDSSNGNPVPSGLISGDGFVSTSTIKRTINASNWNDDSLFLSIDYRVISNTAASRVTNAQLEISDSNGNSLYTHHLVSGGTRDTTWQTFSRDISNDLNGLDSFVIELSQEDLWGANWQQKAYFDNFYVGYDDPAPSQGASGASGASGDVLPLTQRQIFSEQIQLGNYDLYDYVNGIRVIGLNDDLIDELLLAYNVTAGN